MEIEQFLNQPVLDTVLYINHTEVNSPHPHILPCPLYWCTTTWWRLAGDEVVSNFLGSRDTASLSPSTHPFIKDRKIFVPQDHHTGGYSCPLKVLCGKTLSYGNWASVYRHLLESHNLLASKKNTFLLSDEGQQVTQKQAWCKILRPHSFVNLIFSSYCLYRNVLRLWIGYVSRGGITSGGRWKGMPRRTSLIVTV